MKHTEIFKKWAPTSDQFNGLEFDFILENKEGLVIEFVDLDCVKRFRFHFKKNFSHRSTDNISRLSASTNPTYSEQWMLYLVEESEYISWLCEQSLHCREAESFVHYLFFTEDDVIDVLALEAPIVTCVPLQQE